jgi:hypothetical protein
MSDERLTTNQRTSGRNPERADVSEPSDWSRDNRTNDSAQDTPWWSRRRGIGRNGRIANARGLRLSALKAAYLYRGIAILTLNTLIFFAGLEFVSWSSFTLKDLISSPSSELVGEGSAREKVSYYSSQPWARRYWYEFRLSRQERYYPYVGWRRAPFRGETINVDQNGIRLTPGADCRVGSFKVFTFGESAMWGTGSPDWGTIPAYLQKGFEKTRHGPVCVVNFAESAYVSTQDVIMLLLQLRSANIPDLVVSYSITSDIVAAYVSGRAGVHANVEQIAARFQSGGKSSTFVDGLTDTYSYALINMLISKVTDANYQQKISAELEGMTPSASELVTYETRGVVVKELSDAIVQTYLANYRLVNALARKNGFEYFFFVQPIVSLGEKRLTPEEQEMKNSLESDVALKKLMTAVYSGVKTESSNYKKMLLLSDVFDHDNSLIWIDAGHVTPFGNEIVARRMLNIIRSQSVL